MVGEVCLDRGYYGYPASFYTTFGIRGDTCIEFA